MTTCVFCAIVAGTSPATLVEVWPDAIALVAVPALVDGHVLVIPKIHVDDALDEPRLTGQVMRRAASIAPRPSNLITSCGPEASQTVFHLHIHVLPRAAGDGLVLPWTGGAS